MILVFFPPMYSVEEREAGSFAIVIACKLFMIADINGLILCSYASDCCRVSADYCCCGSHCLLMLCASIRKMRQSHLTMLIACSLTVMFVFIFWLKVQGGQAFTMEKVMKTAIAALAAHFPTTIISSRVGTK